MKPDVPDPIPAPMTIPPRHTSEAEHEDHISSPTPECVHADFMILSDGTLYARNLTPELAVILAALNPHDSSMALRAAVPTP